MKKLNMAILALALVLALIPATCAASADAPASRAEGESYVFGMLASAAMSQDEFNAFTAKLGFLDSYVFYNNLPSMLLDLQGGKLTGITMLPETAAKYLAARNDSLYYKDFWVLKGELAFGMATSADYQALCDTLDQAIAQLEADETLDALAQQYLSDEAMASEPAPVALPRTDGDTVRVLVTGDMPPMDVVLADGSPAGYNVALLSEISALTGLNFEIVQADSDARTSMLASGRADVIFWAGSVDLTYGDTQITLGDLPDGYVSTRPYIRDRLVEVKTGL